MQTQQKQNAATSKNQSQPISFSNQTGEVRKSSTISERILTIRNTEEKISSDCSSSGWGN